ncbi:hypothetical protein PAAG_05478 [Paracoccidioides lutzii Pb01]|uniref:Extracellular protein n=1 Tax=Paracoccidioides lutzii (strain ATCC MYA-826 / Pb01) TaxID=502779 RepID=C1H3Y5_PARBA|nr:hypothetical protein PAAG_05478 [Paracoccidioides lutzii Pb01]EEH34429.1 hypothetical protein PAAG_05478 [Paracoccidioides lutzii Pb01]
MHSLSLLTVAVAARSAFAHMEMREPLALRSRFGSGPNVDYSNTSPLLTDGSDFPCKGYHHDKGTAPVAVYGAGETVQLKLEGTATHGGGSCQVSLSYNGGVTFRVIKSMIGGCPLAKSYAVEIPHSAPRGEVLFAWTWFNLIGNREMYMNCAMVRIEGGSENTTNFDSFPKMFVANVGNGRKTVEGVDTVFPNPGANVVYGHGLGPASGGSSPAAIKASHAAIKASPATAKASSSTAKASPATAKASSAAVTSSQAAISIPSAWNTTLYNSTTSSHATLPTAPYPTHHLNATTSTPAPSSYSVFRQHGNGTSPVPSASTTHHQNVYAAAPVPSSQPAFQHCGSNTTPLPSSYPVFQQHGNSVTSISSVSASPSQDSHAATPASSSYPIFIQQGGSYTTSLPLSSAASQHRSATTATLSGLSLSGTVSAVGSQGNFSLHCSCSWV